MVETGATIMAGMNCGTTLSLAWPYIDNGLDAAVAVSHEADAVAARDLNRLGIAAGPCGAESPSGLGRRQHRNPHHHRGCRGQPRARHA